MATDKHSQKYEIYSKYHNKTHDHYVQQNMKVIQNFESKLNALHKGQAQGKVSFTAIGCS